MARIHEYNGTTTDIVSPKIVIDWNPYTNDGPVTFYMEQLIRNGEEVLERSFVGVMPAKIQAILERTVTIDINGTPTEFSGTLLMGLIKQVFDDLYFESIDPPAPEELPPSEEVPPGE